MSSNPSIAVFVAAMIAMGATPVLGQVINEDLKLVASDGAPQNYLGLSIAIDNGIVAIGAFRDDDNGIQSGSAYLFDAATGDQIAKLLPSDGAERDWFGYSIALGNGVVAVGSPFDDDRGSDAGSAYLFDASTGAQIAKLLPSDGGWFGFSMAIDDGIVTIGAVSDGGSGSGAAYLFDVSTGEQLFKLLPNDGARGDWFGGSIAIDNGVVAVGAMEDNDNGSRSGSAFLFDASTGTQIVKLLPNDGAWESFFGSSIAIDDGIVAVGAMKDAGWVGSAYLFDASTGAQIVKLVPTDGAGHDEFGRSIAIDNGVVTVGAHYHAGSDYDSGAAYLFDASTGAQIAKLLASDGAYEDWFGVSIAIDNGIVAVGALGDDDNGDGSGSAYLFTVPEGDCPADITGDGLVNTRDFIAFLNAWATGDPLADWNGDGNINTQDFIAYLNDWAEGCP